MNKRKRAFTLVELLVVIIIASVLLLMATDRFIIGAFVANNSYNQNIDLQAGVKASKENIKNILKKSVQVHLVGKEVYEPDMDLKNLDERYNYIAFREDPKGNIFLANLVYNKSKKEFDVIPLSAVKKNDVMNHSDINYQLTLYKGDTNYKKKLDKNMLDFTVKGVSKTKGKGLKNQEFEITESLRLPNVNQILISKHLQGGIKDITAIAYDEDIIKPGDKGVGKVGIVFIIDDSQSMQNTFYDEFPITKDEKNFKFAKIIDGFPWNDHLKIEELADPKKAATKNDILDPLSDYTTRRYVAGRSINESFLDKLNDIGKKKNIEIDAYIYKYDTKALSMNITEPGNFNAKYLYSLSDLEKQGYGPYRLNENKKPGDTTADTNTTGDVKPKKLEDAKAHVTGNCNMSFKSSDHKLNSDNWYVMSGSTNTGLGLLQGFEILHQLKDKGIEKRFLVLLTDGVPSARTFYWREAKTHESINNLGEKEENELKFLVNRELYNKNGGYTGLIQHNVYTSGHKDEYSKAMKYVEMVTDPHYNNNVGGLYEKAYIIGFSKIPEDKSKLGLPEKDGTVKKHSLNSYLKKSGNEVLVYDSSDKTTLDSAFENIVKDIGVNISVFDGPNRMKSDSTTN